MVRLLAAGRSTVVFGICSLAIAVALLAAAVPAGAVVAKIGGHGYGITPISGAGEASLAAAYRAHSRASGAGARGFDEPPFGGSPLQNVENGPVMHSVTTHVVYWDPGAQFTNTTKEIVGSFFTDVEHDSGLPTNAFAVAGQYTDSTGHAAYSSTFAGALFDAHAYPTSGNCTVPNEVDKGPYAKCLFDKQLQEELTTVIAENGLPRGPSQLYFVLLPHNIATCLPETIGGKQVCSNNFYCAYHSYVNPATANEVIYADIPFSLLDTGFAKGCQSDGHAQVQLPNGDAGTSNTETRFADVALKYISHEYIEAVTDPLVNVPGNTAWVDEEGQEIGDKCNGVPFGSEEEGEPGFDKHAFTPTLGGSAVSGTLFNQSINTGSFYLQSEWDNGGKACLMKPVTLLEAAFTSGTATAGSPVSFNGSSSDPYGGFAPTWSFGDGGTATGASPSHTFAAAGEYTVTMTPTDALTGSTGAPVGHTVSVAAAKQPSSQTPTTTTTSTSSAAPTPAPAPPPVVAPAPAVSAFSTRSAGFNAKSGAISFTESVADPGTFVWLATFQNGKFGAFASSSRCKAGTIRLAGKCRPTKIVFARGSEAVATAGAANITLKPTPSALKALQNALKKGKGVPVSVVLTYRSARGGAPVSHVVSLTVKLKR